MTPLPLLTHKIDVYEAFHDYESVICSQASASRGKKSLTLITTLHRDGSVVWFRVESTGNEPQTFEEYNDARDCYNSII